MIVMSRLQAAFSRNSTIDPPFHYARQSTWVIQIRNDRAACDTAIVKALGLVAKSREFAYCGFSGLGVTQPSTQIMTVAGENRCRVLQRAKPGASRESMRV